MRRCDKVRQAFDTVAGLTTPPVEIEVKLESSIIETETEKTFIIDSNIGGVEISKETKEIKKVGRPKKS